MIAVLVALLLLNEHTDAEWKVVGQHGVIDRPHVDAGKYYTFIDIETIPVHGRIFSVQFYAGSTSSNLTVWLFRKIPGAPDDQTLTPVESLPLHSSELVTALNNNRVDWKCMIGDRIGLSGFKSGVVKYDTSTTQHYWTASGSDSMPQLYQAQTFTTEAYGKRVFSFAALYYEVEGFVGAIGNRDIIDQSAGPWTFVHQEPLPADATITKLQFYARKAKPTKLWLMRVEDAETPTILTPMEELAIDEDDVDTGSNEIIVNWSGKQGDMVAFSWWSGSVIPFDSTQYQISYSAAKVVSKGVKQTFSTGFHNRDYAFGMWYIIKENYTLPTWNDVEGTFREYANDTTLTPPFLYTGDGVSLQACLLTCALHEACSAASWGTGQCKHVADSNWKLAITDLNAAGISVYYYIS